jgi:fimbrial isopeptide formation D2 family protein
MRKLLPIFLLILGMASLSLGYVKADTASGSTFSVTKTATPDTVAPSANVTFTISVKNITAAGSPNATPQTVTDTLPTGFTFTTASSQLTGLDGTQAAFAPTVSGQTLTWQFSGTTQISMAPGDVIVISFSAVAPATTGTYTNQACLTLPESVCAEAQITVQSSTPNTGVLQNLAIAGGIGAVLVFFSVKKSKKKISFEQSLLTKV